MAFLAFSVRQNLLWRNQFLKMWKVNIPWILLKLLNVISILYVQCPSSLPSRASSVMRSALWSKSLPKVGTEYGKGACDQRQCLWQNRWTGSKVPKSKIGDSNRAYDWLYLSMCSYLELLLSCSCLDVFFLFWYAKPVSSINENLLADSDVSDNSPRVVKHMARVKI